jgi:hypothetical protein
MPKRKLALGLASAMGLVLAADLALSLGLALHHEPFATPLISMMTVIPGLVVAGLAWQGRLPTSCDRSDGDCGRAGWTIA